MEDETVFAIVLICLPLRLCRTVQVGKGFPLAL